MPPKINGKNAKDIKIKGIGTPTLRDVEALLNMITSAGLVVGGTITDSGYGQVDVSAAYGIIRITNSETGELCAFNIAATTDISLTDKVMNFIYIDYNAGSPIYVVTTNYDSINLHSQIVVGRVYRNGNLLNIANIGQRTQDHVLKDLYRIQSTRKLEWASGSIISYSNRYPIVSAGILFSNYDKVTTAAVDCSSGGTFVAWYRDGVGGWTQVTGQTQIDNNNYDSGTGTLTALGVGDYGVHWVYQLTDGSIQIQYGQSTYTSLANARNATVPSSQPIPVIGMGLLLGRYIILKGATAIYEATSAFSYVFTGTATTSHQDLGSLQGGTSGQMYHLSSADYAVRNLPVVEVSGTTQQAVIRTRYVTTNSSLTTVTLPTTAAVGDVVAITGYGAGLWKLAQNASQLIHFLSLVTTTGTGGYIQATTRYDTIIVRCVEANTTWVVENAVGNLDVI